MFFLHCTKKAQDRLKVKPTECRQYQTTLLGDWYCHGFTASRHKYLVFVNEQTLLPVVIPVKGLEITAEYFELFKQRLFKAFISMNLPDDKFMPELLEMDDVNFAKTANRSVIGSMNEIISEARFLSELQDMDVDSPAMFERLSTIPLKANNYKHSTELVTKSLLR